MKRSSFVLRFTDTYHMQSHSCCENNLQLCVGVSEFVRELNNFFWKTRRILIWRYYRNHYRNTSVAYKTWPQLQTYHDCVLSSQVTDFHLCAKTECKVLHFVHQELNGLFYFVALFPYFMRRYSLTLHIMRCVRVTYPPNSFRNFDSF